MFDDLYSILPERQLMNDYRQINTPVTVHGSCTGYVGHIYTEEPNQPGVYDFTDSFSYYMKENIDILPFDFAVVPGPAFSVLHISPTNTTPPTNSAIGSTTLNLTKSAFFTKPQKLPFRGTQSLILSFDALSISPIYNQILTYVANEIKRAGLNKKFYFYKLIANTYYNVNSFEPELNFIMRSAIEIKGF